MYVWTLNNKKKQKKKQRGSPEVHCQQSRFRAGLVPGCSEHTRGPTVPPPDCMQPHHHPGSHQ